MYEGRGKRKGRPISGRLRCAISFFLFWSFKPRGTLYCRTDNAATSCATVPSAICKGAITHATGKFSGSMRRPWPYRGRIGWRVLVSVQHTRLVQCDRYAKRHGRQGGGAAPTRPLSAHKDDASPHTEANETLRVPRFLGLLLGHIREFRDGELLREGRTGRLKRHPYRLQVWRQDLGRQCFRRVPPGAQARLEPP
jgi:hypothetical protein